MNKVMVQVAAAIPLHGPVDQILLGKLTDSMERKGWTGRPLLGVDLGDVIGLLTGSHRYVAAGLAGLAEIPVLVLTVADLKYPAEIEEDNYQPPWGLDGGFIADELERIGAPAKAIALAKRER